MLDELLEKQRIKEWEECFDEVYTKDVVYWAGLTPNSYYAHPFNRDLICYACGDDAKARVIYAATALKRSMK